MRGSLRLHYVFYTWKRGLRSGLHGVDYSRFFEYPWAVDALRAGPDHALLDIGSGQGGTFPLLVADRTSAGVTATDICDHAESLRAHARALGHQARLANGRIRFLQVDATRLPFADASFSRVSAISTIEHIPGDGDTRAIREMARVLAPGGRMVITVPYNYELRAEVYMQEPVYGRNVDGGRAFFQRIYDDELLAERLVGPSGLRVERAVYFGEPGISFGRFLYAKHKSLMAHLLLRTHLLFPLMPLWSWLFLKEVDRRELHRDDWAGVGTGFVLVRPT